MSAEERRLELSGMQMLHTSGTKHYGLFTLVDVATKAAVGLQVWGPVGEISGSKLITGTEANVSDQQQSKQREKNAKRKGERYEVATRHTPADYPASKMAAVIKARLVGMAPGTSTRKIDEIAEEMFMKLGVAFKVAANEVQEQEKAKTKQEQMQERQQKGADYNGMWGAW